MGKMVESHGSHGEGSNASRTKPYDEGLIFKHDPLGHIRLYDSV